MREIKFRAKRIDIDRWIYGQYFTTPLTDENSGTKPDAGWFFLTGETRHCIVQNCVAFVIDLNTLGQYTGLIDKNGKEIYEGDIHEIGSESGVVEYHDGTYFVMSRDEEGDFFVCRYLYQELSVEKGEVIGNVYGNADFLKG